MTEDSNLPIRHRPAHPEPRVLVNRPTIVFVTLCTADRRPLLANEAAASLLVDTWRNATAWLVGRYVIMPDHVHFFAAPAQPSLPLKNWIRFCKSQFTKRYGESIWQIDYWDTMLRNGDSYEEKWRYVRNNPVRHGLVKCVDEWQFQGQMNLLPWY